MAKKSSTYRLDTEMLSRLKHLSIKYDMSQASVIELAVNYIYKMEQRPEKSTLIKEEIIKNMVSDLEKRLQI